MAAAPAPSPFWACLPGEYNLTLLVSSTFENLTQQVPVSVRATLPAMAVATGSRVLVAGWPVTFFPHPLPSPGGVLYTWDFGDGSPAVTQPQPEVNHTFASSGAYHIRLEVNNTVSSTVASISVRVFEELRGLTVSLSPAVEQGAPVVVSASLDSGDNVTWTFDMGDGTVPGHYEDRPSWGLVLPTSILCTGALDGFVSCLG